MDLLSMLGMALGGGGEYDEENASSTGNSWEIPEDGGPMALPGLVPQKRPVGMGNPMERKSLLGIGGKARDILGSIGDALLIGNDAKPMYKPARDQEKLQDILRDSDLSDTDGVFKKMFQVNPEMAMEYLKTTSLADYRSDGLDIRRGDLSRKTTKDALTAEDKIVQGLGGYAGSVDDQPKLQRFREIADRRLSAYGLTSDDIGIPKTFTPGVMQDWATRGIPAYKQRMLEQGNVRLGQGQQNADSNRIKANAAASNASSTAAQVPGKIANTNARTGLATANTDRVYGRNGTIQSGSQPSLLGGAPTGGGLPPGLRASKGPNDKIRVLSTGEKLQGDGKGGWISKGK
jgi:hypothetical protein